MSIFRYHAHEFHDFDQSKYKIINESSNPETTKLGFTCFGAKQILENGGEDYLKYKFGDYYNGDTLDGYEVVLSLGPDKKPQKQSVPEGATDDEKAKIKEENGQIKQKIYDLAEKVAQQWCTLKSDFMGAPIRKALTDLIEESKDTYTVCIPYRPSEKYWVKKGATNVQVFFTIDFRDPTDIALGKIMCNELKDSKKISAQAVTVGYYQKQDQNADLYSELGVSQKDASCGIISFALTSTNVKKNLDTAVYFLTTFRQYMEFHIRMTKSLLHTKMRNRIAKFEIVFERALRQGATSKENFKKTIGGEQISDKAKVEKVEVLSKKKEEKPAPKEVKEHTIGDD